MLAIRMSAMQFMTGPSSIGNDTSSTFPVEKKKFSHLNPLQYHIWLNGGNSSPRSSENQSSRHLLVSAGYHSTGIRNITFPSSPWSRGRLQPRTAAVISDNSFGIREISTSREPVSPGDHDSHSQNAVMIALLCNALVFMMKIGIYGFTRSGVMLAEAIHSLADLANQGLLAYGLLSSRRAPDKIHPYGYTKERFVWALISATGIFCLGSGLTIVHGVQCLYHPEEIQNVYMAGTVIAISSVMEGASLYVAYKAVTAGAKAENMTFTKYLWNGHDPTAVAVLLEDGAAVTGLGIAAISMAAVYITGNPIYDAIGSITVGGLLGVVALILIGRNRESLIGRSMDDEDVRKVIKFLRQDPVVDAVWDCKSEVIGPGAYRFKAEIDFNGITVVRNHLKRVGREKLYSEVRKAASQLDDSALDKVLGNYGEELMTALGSEVDRLEREIRQLVPEILHLDIEAHNPLGPIPTEKLYEGQLE